VTELQQSRYDQLLRRVGDLKGPGSKVNDVLQELFPMIDVENVPGELLLLMGTRLCAGASQGTGSVGEAFRIQVFNPVDSGMLITVTSLIASYTTNAVVRIGTTETALTTGIGTEVFRDRRLALTDTPVGEIRQVSSVALTDANLIFRTLAGTPVKLTDPNGLAVLPPGTGLEVGTTNLAIETAASFLWRERVAEPSELNL